MRLLHWSIAFLLASSAALASLAVLPAFAQTPATQASVRPDIKAVDRDGKKVRQVDVVVSDVTNLGAFEFVLGFNGGVLALDDNPVEKGVFLGSSGREVFCDDPTIQQDALRFACVTLGDTPAEGATGSGVLASVYFKVVGDGTSSLEFTRPRLGTPPGDPIESTWQPGSISVGSSDSSSWLMWLLIAIAVVVALLVVVAVIWRRRRRVAQPASAAG